MTASRIVMLMVLSLLPLSTLVALEGQWKTYTAKRSVTDLASDSTTIWAATSGGAFSYTMSTGAFREFATAEGLHSIDLTAVAIDGSGDVWFGASNGVVHRYNPSTGEWQYVTDIFQIQNPQKRINALRVYGDSLVILSDLGVSMLSISKMQFGDTYFRFGPDSVQITGNALDFTFYHGNMWVATRSGIATTPVSNVNPSVPQSWQVFNFAKGLPTNYVTALAVLADTLYAATSAGLVRLNGSTWDAIPATAGLVVIDMSARSVGVCPWCTNASVPLLAFMTADNLYAFSPSTNQLDVVSGFGTPLTRLARSGGWLAGTQSLGVMNNFQPPSFVIPPGPPSNSFIGIAVDNRGVLWSGTGISNGAGFMSFDGANWRLYSHDSDPRLDAGNNYYQVSVGANNCKWVSNAGRGIALVDDQGRLVKILDATNGLPPAVDTPAPPPARSHFVVVGGVATSPDGSAWLSVRTPPPDTSLVVFMPDSSLRYVLTCGPGCNMRSPQNIVTNIAIDQNGTKWFANFSRFESFTPNRAIGFYFYNDQISLPGTSGGWGFLTTDDGITSTEVWSVAVDQDDALWIGTDQGLSIIFDPSNPHADVAIYHPLRDQVIQAIVPDALNNKWIATKNGVFEISPDGTDILSHYTVENTDGKLLSDDVASVAIDNHTGTVFFGTENGLSALSTAAVTPTESLGELSISPNPYYLPARTELLVDGLTAGSTLKILRIDGGLVREVATPGGRIAYWDGKDRKGTLVPTGVYLIVAYSQDGTSVAKGKVAVIRR